MDQSRFNGGICDFISFLRDRQNILALPTGTALSNPRPPNSPRRHSWFTTIIGVCLYVLAGLTKYHSCMLLIVNAIGYLSSSGFNAAIQHKQQPTTLHVRINETSTLSSYAFGPHLDPLNGTFLKNGLKRSRSLDIFNHRLAKSARLFRSLGDVGSNQGRGIMGYLQFLLYQEGSYVHNWKQDRSILEGRLNAVALTHAKNNKASSSSLRGKNVLAVNASRQNSPKKHGDQTLEIDSLIRKFIKENDPKLTDTNLNNEPIRPSNAASSSQNRVRTTKKTPTTTPQPKSTTVTPLSTAKSADSKEDNDDDDQASIAEVRQIEKIFKVVSYFFLAAIVFSNILVLTAYYRYHRLRIITNRFVVSLAIADLCVGLSRSIQEILEYLDPTSSKKTNAYRCLFFGNFPTTMNVASLLNLLGVTIDRYISVMYPLRYNSIMTEKLANTIIISAWSISFLIIFVVPHFFYIKPDRKFCTYPYLFKYILTTYFIMYVTILFTISLFYAKIFYECHKHVLQNIFSKDFSERINSTAATPMINMGHSPDQNKYASLNNASPSPGLKNGAQVGLGDSGDALHNKHLSGSSQESFGSYDSVPKYNGVNQSQDGTPCNLKNSITNEHNSIKMPTPKSHSDYYQIDSSSCLKPLLEEDSTAEMETENENMETSQNVTTNLLPTEPVLNSTQTTDLKVAPNNSGDNPVNPEPSTFSLSDNSLLQSFSTKEPNPRPSTTSNNNNATPSSLIQQSPKPLHGIMKKTVSHDSLHPVHHAPGNSSSGSLTIDRIETYADRIKKISGGSTHSQISNYSETKPSSRNVSINETSVQHTFDVENDDPVPHKSSIESTKTIDTNESLNLFNNEHEQGPASPQQPQQDAASAAAAAKMPKNRSYKQRLQSLGSAIIPAKFFPKHQSDSVDDHSLSTRRESAGVIIASKTTIMIAMIVGTFAMLGLPLQVVEYVLIFHLELIHNHKLFYILHGVCVLLYYSNSAVNPYIYAWKNRDFRDSFKHILTCSTKRNNRGYSLPGLPPTPGYSYRGKSSRISRIFTHFLPKNLSKRKTMDNNQYSLNQSSTAPNLKSKSHSHNALTDRRGTRYHNPDVLL